MLPALRCRVLPVLLALSLFTIICFSQEKTVPDKAAPAVCDLERSLDLARRQAAEAKALHQSPADILILTQAADQLWPWHEKEARELLTTAYDLTDKYFREPFDDIGQWKKVWSQTSNPHFAVIAVIARRDPEWGRQLGERVRTDAERFALPAADDFDPSGRRLGAALALLPVNQPLAVALAQSSLRYPASRSLLSFLFTLAEVDQRQADALFLEALRASQRRPISVLLTLAPYSLRLNRVVCEGDY
ncbi:MAG: hypothetical protein U0Z53_27670 [Blastocatellia bacterium]